MKSIPEIRKYMTAVPHTISKDATLDKAEEIMREYRIRHLPVLDGGKLFGILSDRDVKMVETFRDVDPKKVTVEDACTTEPFIISPSAALSEVCKQMAAHKYSCALVEDNHKLVGIFTWVDALLAMGELLETRLKH